MTLNNNELITSFRISLTNPIRIKTVSDNIYDLLGYKADDFLSGKISFQNLIHADDKDLTEKLFSEEIKHDSVIINIRLRQSNGQICCIRAQYKKTFDSTAENIDLQLDLQDSKFAKQIFNELSLMANFKAMMDNTDDYIYFKDHNHVFTGASQTLVAITNPSNHWTDLIGKTDYDVFPEEYADIYYRLEKLVFAGVDVAHEIQETIDKFGNKGWVDNRKYPIKNDNNEIIGLFGIARVITERKLAEIALRKSEEYLKESQLIAGLGSYVFDIKSGTWQSSNILDVIFGIDNNFERSEHGWDTLIHPEDFNKEKSFFSRRVENMRISNTTEFRIVRPSDKSERYIRGFDKLVLNNQGQPLQIQGTIQDVTDSKQELLAEKRAVLGNKLIGILTVKDRKVNWANPAFESMMGYDSGELVGKSTRQIYANDESYETVGKLYAVLDKEVVANAQQELLRKDGQRVWVDMSATILHHDTGETLWVFVDITKHKLVENELRIAAIAFESLQGIVVTDANSIILRVNHAFTTITGYSADEVIGQNPRLLSSGRQNEEFYCSMWTNLKVKGVWEGEIWNRRKNGEIYPEQLAITAVKDISGVITNYVATLTDITMNKAASDEIKNLAFYDPLTQLPNRRLLLDRLNQNLLANERIRNHSALLFLDLDYFKTLNDTLGHNIGDMLLQQVAQRLTECVRESDTVARIGGDEFVVLLENLSSKLFDAAAQTELIGNKILAKLNQPYQLISHEYHSTPSIGATLFDDHHYEVEDLLKQADIAMYQAKKAGRNTMRFFDPVMQETINARADMERDLRIAVDKKQFALHYQVQVDDLSNPIGAEALIRWHHPERGLVSPFNFIPLAEETGLILSIGQWVLETACVQLKVWEKHAQTKNLSISVNVSPKQFNQVDFVVQVQNIVQQYKINPALLKLELTESMLIDNIDNIIITMVALQSIGIRFELDDFGTGYSSLQYLKQLPLYQLKIDQSFVRDLATDSSGQAIVSTIIAMAKSLNLGVIAEGVETIEQQQFLLNSGCRRYQGYLFGKPLPIEQFDEALFR